MLRGVSFILLFCLLALMPSRALAQTDHDRIVAYGSILDGDTIPLFKLREITVRSTSMLLTPEEIRKNQKLIRNVKKMLPYAKIGKKRLDELELACANLPAKKRTELIKKAEKDITNEYSEELKACTFSQGKVLLKLIDRETGRTSYTLVNELRGKIRAGVYQTFGRIFGYNLKTHYDPKNNKEDDLIERICRSIEHGKL